jgi:PadR family transcriptional regulator, regulatory protein PadR
MWHLARSAAGLANYLSAPGTMYCMVPGEDTNWLAQIRRGVAEQCVLALLTGGEKYGFELARELGARGQIIASEGTLYPLLARLRRNGLVETSWRESNAGPPRRYYHLTRDGELALASFTKQWRVFRDAVDEILSEGSRE